MIFKCYRLDILFSRHPHDVANSTELLSDTVSFVRLNAWYFSEGYASSEQLAVIDDIFFNGVKVIVLTFKILVKVQASPSVDRTDKFFWIPATDINPRPFCM